MLTCGIIGRRAEWPRVVLAARVAAIAHNAPFSNRINQNFQENATAESALVCFDVYEKKRGNLIFFRC